MTAKPPPPNDTASSATGELKNRLDRAIRVAILLLLPALLGQTWGCQDTDHFANWDPGPEVSAEDIDQVLGDPQLQGDPYTIELGQGFVFSETQELVGLGAPPFVAADTVRTIVSLEDTPSDSPEVRLLTMVEHRFIYDGNETKQISTEVPLSLDLTTRQSQKSQTPIATQFTQFNQSIEAQANPLTPLGPSSTPIKHSIRTETLSALEALQSARSVHEIKTTLAAFGEISRLGLSAQSERISFHKLSVQWIDRAPPKAVRDQPNCGEVPGCVLKTCKISFDMIFWAGSQPDRTHWQFEISPTAPFLAQILDRCVSSLVGVGDGNTSYLIKQCQPVMNFKYRQ